MNKEIKDLVGKYVSEGDYEKALSLLINLPIEDDNDQALLETCKKEFTASCTTAITDAVKAKDKNKAEITLLSYKKLLGDDANTVLFQTLVDGIKEKTTLSEALGNIPTNSVLGIFENCTPATSFLKSKVMWIVYSWLAILIFFLGCVSKANIVFCFAAIAVAISLAVPTINSSNSRFKPVGLILLLIPIIVAIVNYNSSFPQNSGPRTLTWLSSFLYIIVFNSLIPSKSWTFRSVISILLFTILDPMWYGMGFTPAVEDYSVLRHYKRFSPYSNVWIVLATWFTLAIYYCIFVEASKDDIIHKLIEMRDEVMEKAFRYRKQVWIGLSVVFGLFILITIGVSIKNGHDRKVAEQQAIEKARQDSIQAVENARLAAIEKARQDSIEAEIRREQARRDSIDYAEHAGFVKKYANIGLIITDLGMTRGTNDNGVASKGIKFTIFNPTHKTIKYVIANMHAVNKFNDRVSYDQRCRGMGPVDSHEYGSWDFNDVFDDKNDIIDDLMVSFTVVYTNGSSKMVRWKDAYVSDFKESWFYGR